MIVEEVKTKLYELIKSLGYNITDNARYVENFPWLMLRTSNHQNAVSFDVRFDNMTFIVDVFSNYPGEKEILEIAENITAHLQELRGQIEGITQAYQSTLKIIHDKATGPVRKHGIIGYQFILARQEKKNDSTEH